LATQAANDSILAQIVVTDGGATLLTSSLFALAICVILSIFTGATEIPAT
jgi:hypothetical protein